MMFLFHVVEILSTSQVCGISWMLEKLLASHEALRFVESLII